MKREYIEENNADFLIMGDDWAGKFDELNDICEVVYPSENPPQSLRPKLLSIFCFLGADRFILGNIPSCEFTDLVIHGFVLTVKCNCYSL